MRSIIFFTKYSYAGASSRYRVFQYKSYFEQAGFNIQIEPLFTDDYLEKLYAGKPISKAYIITRYVRRFLQVLRLQTKQQIYIEYELLPFFPAWLERWLKWRGVRYVVDYDDAIFHKYDQHKNSIIRKLFSNKIATVIKCATRVIAGSSYLFDYAKQFNTSVVLIPTSICLQKYLHISQENKDDSFVVGWIGLASNSINVINILPAIKKFAEGKNVKLVLIGFDEKLAPSFKGLNTEIRHWSEESEIKDIASFDVGIMPLIDTPFNQGKCGFKLIQYMACAKPTISTPLPANLDINVNNQNLFATTIEEWQQALEIIYSKRNYYSSKVGRNNLEIIKTYYSVEANALKLVEVFLTEQVLCAE